MGLQAHPDGVQRSKRQPVTRYGRGWIVTAQLDEDIDELRAEIARLWKALDGKS